MGPIIRQSQDAADTLTGPGKCGSGDHATGARTTAAASVRGAAAGHLAVGEAELRRQHVHRAGVDPRFIEDNWSLGRIGNESADASAGTLINAFDFNQKYGHAPAIILNDTTGEVTKMIHADRADSSAASSPARQARQARPVRAPTAPGVPASPVRSGRPAKAADAGPRRLDQLPKVTLQPRHRQARRHCSPAPRRAAPRCHADPRPAVPRHVAGQPTGAPWSGRNRVKFTLSARPPSRSGRYTIRLTVDAGGRVGSLTRYVRVR